MTHRLRARWIFPVDRAPIENGVIEFAEGTIVGLSNTFDSHAFDLGNFALIPGLVNAHTHLELSDHRAPLGPTAPFTGWLAAVIDHRRKRAAEGFVTSSAVQVGGRESHDTGTTLLGDIVSPDWSSAWLTEPRPRTIAFLELLGLSPERVAPQLEAAAQHFENARNSPAEFIPGLSPHAPYSVHPDLFRGLVDLAVSQRAPFAFHLAETPQELELLAHATGPFVDFLTQLGVWRPDAIPRGTRPLDYLQQLAALDHALVVHGNYLSAKEIEFLAGHQGISVVYCPRTHSYFGHAPHPWRTLLARDVNVALGTDSRASTPDLNLWNEVLHLQRQFPKDDPALFLELATRRGARALGEEKRTGTLTPGKNADFAIVQLPDLGGTDPYELLYAREARISACGADLTEPT